MSEMPGDGCCAPDKFHTHWCGFCGALLWFSVEQCRLLRFVPPCPRCREKDWRT